MRPPLCGLVQVGMWESVAWRRFEGLFPSEVAGSRVTKHGLESPKISISSPFDEHTLQRYFSRLDCAAGTQSGANPFNRLGGPRRGHFQPRNRQPFASRRNKKSTTFSLSVLKQILRRKRVSCRIRCMLRRHRLLAADTKGTEGSNLTPSAMQSGLQRNYARSEPKYANSARISRLFLDKPDCGERTAQHRMRYCRGFSPAAACAVRFLVGHSANAMRSKTEDSTMSS
jgi:hypothetical protein